MANRPWSASHAHQWLIQNQGTSLGTPPQEHIEAMKQWCMENYSNGADTMVECWEHQDYVDLFISYDGNPLTPDEAWLALKTLAEVYSDQQADARNSAF